MGVDPGRRASPVWTGGRGEDALRAFGGELVDYPLPEPETYEVNMGVEYAVTALKRQRFLLCVRM